MLYLDGNGDPLPSPLPNPFLTSSQTITARVISATSQDPDGACYDETEIEFEVDAAAVAYSVADLVECDDNGDGLFAFDTSTIEETLLNGQTGMRVLYFDANGSPLPTPLPNPFTTATQSISVRVENELSTACFDETTINFVVSEQPVAHTIADDLVCDDVTNDGVHSFTLSEYDSQILNGQSATIFEVLYFDDDTEAQSNMGVLGDLLEVNVAAMTLYARIQNRNNPNCFDITSFRVGVNYLPIAHQPNNLSVCDDESNDGTASFDLSLLRPQILNGQSETTTNLTFHSSPNEVENGTGSLGELFTNTQNPQTIYARLENNLFPNCYTTTSFQIHVREQPVLRMDEQWPICQGNTVEVVADQNYDEYLWSTGDTCSFIVVDMPGDYTVIATNVYGNLRCETSKTISVVESGIATIIEIETLDWTQRDNSISVLVEGDGTMNIL